KPPTRSEVGAKAPSTPSPLRQGEPDAEGRLLRFGSDRLRHGTDIRNSALSPDGKLLATAGDKSVIIWELKSGKKLHYLPYESAPRVCAPSRSSRPGQRCAPP